MDGKPLLPAYSIVSANYEDHLEFFSIKVAGCLADLAPAAHPGGDKDHRRTPKPTGTLRSLTTCCLARTLYLVGTGTGLALPFLCLIRDQPPTKKLKRWSCSMACVRSRTGLCRLHQRGPAQRRIPGRVRPRRKLLYYPSVTREPFKNRGRATDLLAQRQAGNRPRSAQLDPARDRIMICGSPALNKRHARAAQRAASSKAPPRHLVTTWSSAPLSSSEAMSHYHLYAIGNALKWTPEYEVSDAVAGHGRAKRHMTLIDAARRSELWGTCRAARPASGSRLAIPWLRWLSWAGVPSIPAVSPTTRLGAFYRDDLLSHGVAANLTHTAPDNGQTGCR